MGGRIREAGRGSLLFSGPGGLAYGLAPIRGILLETVGCLNIDLTGVNGAVGGAEVALCFVGEGKVCSSSSRIASGFGATGYGNAVVVLLPKLDEALGGRENTGSADALRPVLKAGRNSADPLRSLEKTAGLRTSFLGEDAASATKTLRTGLRFGSSRDCV